jgi:hypothetical protein
MLTPKGVTETTPIVIAQIEQRSRGSALPAPERIGRSPMRHLVLTGPTSRETLTARSRPPAASGCESRAA